MGIIYEKLKKCKKDLKLINEDIKAIERKGGERRFTIRYYFLCQNLSFPSCPIF
jgi:hypothetical protein